MVVSFLVHVKSGKTVERAIHARSTRDANFDKYKKHSLRGATGIEKVYGGSCIRVFSLHINGPMSVASTVDDLRGFVTRSSGRNA